MSKIKKISAVILSTTTAIWLSGVTGFIPIAQGAMTIAELEAKIQEMLNLIATYKAELTALQGGGVAVSCTFSRALKLGDTGIDVKCLQQYLNSDSATQLASSGVGSSGNETEYFGPITKAAVIKWQNKYASSVLTPLGLSAGTGYFGSSSRSYYSTLAVAPGDGTTPPDDGAPPVAVGTGLTVSLAGEQPIARLFPQSAASVAFTYVNFTASSDGDVTVKALTVERSGSAQDAAFAGVILLDEDGSRIGTSKTFGSTHQVRLPNEFTVKAGTTKRIAIAGDAASSLTSYNGQIAKLNLVSVEAGNTTVNGTLPIAGTTGHTANNTLTLGALTLARGPLDPGVSQTKEVGTTGYIFSSLKMTAGSTEKIKIKSIKWHQSGSASNANDLANVKVYVDTNDNVYATEISSDGKYFTSKFGDGILIDKGLSKEFYIKGDIIDGSARTVDFDLYRYTDIVSEGMSYGYSVTPSATETTADNDDDGDFQNAEPRFDAFVATIGTGSIAVAKGVSVSAQSIAINLSNQPLGGFDVTVKGEDVSVASMNFDVGAVPSAATGSSLDTDDITNITLVDDAGSVVAGPVDGVAGGNNAIRFTDTITFKTGTHTYTLKGKLGTDFANNDTVAASTTPSSDWSTVKGAVTNVTITPSPATALTANTMTVKAADLTVTVSPEPVAQNIVVGLDEFTFAKYVLDASGSGEDIRTSSMKPQLTFATANSADDLTNCYMYDGSTILNTGSNVVNPTNTNSTGDEVTFTFDSGVVTTKGTVKTLELKCDLSGSDGTTYSWGIENAAANIVSTGLTSGQAVTETITTATGQTMTRQSAGTLSIVLDSSSPSLKLIQGGSTDQTIAVFRLTSSYEDIRLERMGLTLATTSSGQQDPSNASNTPQDITKASLWVGSKKVGEAVFTSDFSTTTFTTSFGASVSDYTVPKDGVVLLTAKVDAAAVGISLPGYPGHLIVVNYDANSSDDQTNLGVKGIGQSGGTAIYGAGSITAANGARLVKAIPTVAKIELSSSERALSDGTATLYKFKVSAPAGTNGIGLYKFSFHVSTSTKDGWEDSTDELSPFRVTDFKAYCYEDSSFSNASCGSWDSSGLLNQGGLADDTFTHRTNPATTTAQSTNMREGVVEVTFNPADSALGSTAAAIRISANETRYFVLKAQVIGSSTTSASVTTRLLGDSGWAVGAQTKGGDGADAYVPDQQDALTSVGDTYSTGEYIFATTAALVDIDSNKADNDFIWSPHSTNTSMDIETYDWLNGFLVPGLVSDDTSASQETVSR